MGWKEPEYARNVFRLCLYAHALPIAPLIETINRSFFEPDLRVIERLGQATSPLEFDQALLQFHIFNVRHQQSWRCRFGLRVSGRKLGRFHSEVMGKEIPLADHTAFFTRNPPR